MSVIIKMLQDLEQRQQPGAEIPPQNLAGEFVRPEIQYHSVAKSRSPIIGIIVVAVLLLPTLWFGVSMYRQASIETASEPATIKVSANGDIELLKKQPSSNHEGVVQANFDVKSIPAEVITAVADQNINPVVDQTSTIETAQTTITAVNHTETNDKSQIMVTQTSDKTSDAIQAQALLTTKVATGNPKAASLNSMTLNQMTPSNTSPNNALASPSASNNSEITQAIQGSTSPAPIKVQIARKSEPAPAVKQKPAEMSIKEVVLTKAQMAQLQYRKAIDAEQAERLDDAAGYFLEAIILQPSLHKARKQLVDIYYKQNNPTTAMRLLESGIGMFPQQWEFYVILARIQTELKSYDAALSTLAMIPDNSSWARDKWVAQTELAQSSKNFSLAESAYRHLLVSESTQSRWWMGLGYALDSQKKYSQAAQAYRSALSYEGLSTSAMSFIEKRLVQLGENR
ncbi:tetratricopeptide repeat protein [Shewanella sp. MEBiC00475]|uniref:tetratricopeptide repeat protein n=1 Tax=Shewanella sp. MEBiC00475 TaxID=2575361 RepID=UPI001585E0CB|nr:tetratricopeptide repeat protein [Shewanella sp. MEBiC00475]